MVRPVEPAPALTRASLGDDAGGAAAEASSAVFAAWLLVASLAMLFIGLFAAYAMFRMDKPGDFQRDGSMLSQAMGLGIAAALVGSAVTVSLGAWALRAGRGGVAKIGLLAALVGGIFVLSLIGGQSVAGVKHVTLVARVSSNPADGNYLYDGAAVWSSDSVQVTGDRVLLPTARRVDLHWILQSDLGHLTDPPAPVESGTYPVAISDIDQHSNYFAGRNTFFACYFTTAIMLAACVLGGMIGAVVALLSRKAAGLSAGLGIYFSFLAVVWIVMLRIFYFA